MRRAALVVGFAVATATACGSFGNVGLGQPSRSDAGSAICIQVTPAIGPQPPKVCVPDPLGT